ncbi:nuclear transport factor 2 family protein [Hyalangium versicolor]|uniref:nuclear transport factor 2 family protein n=1 Tax=Hyalangium versicolor TaxID=2861190 RepID=UPI001CCBAAB0|nr:nuclear transport factor 2 family protein [Hyalangium versicolor]
MTEQSATADFRVATYETYLSAWSAIPDDRRLHLLQESVTEGVVFTNPTKPRTGIADVADHLRAFQTRSPGGSFRLVAMLGWEDNAIATWQFVDAAGNSGFTGYDVLAFDGEHRIKSILLFSNVPKQTLK